MAGLAPARVGLKIRLLELLCIHGLKTFAAVARSGNSQEILNSVALFLRSDVGALAAELTRLVGEERPQRRDDGHKSGSNEVGDHGLNVFVRGRRFFVEQVALFAYYPTTQWRLNELAYTETLAHPLTCVAA